MQHQITASINAFVFFVVWLAILYAGADHPPPPGFAVLVLLDLVAAVLVYLRVPAYLNWIATQKGSWLVRVVRDGFAAGLAVALLAVVVSLLVGSTERLIERSMLDLVLWFAVLGIVGAANTVALYLANLAMSKIRTLADDKENQP